MDEFQAVLKFRRRIAVIGLLLVAAPAKAAVATETSPCAFQTANAERSFGIPDRLLDAISKVESGRRDGDHAAAWPWTINAGGVGRFFSTKGEAIEAVRGLQATGVHSIDVGCMQVNLQWHPQAFANLDEAFDPEANVAYAARFLKGLFEATGHWPIAASFYHSQTPSLAAEYLGRLMAVWKGDSTAHPLIPPPSHSPPLSHALISHPTEHPPEMFPLPQLIPRPSSSPAIDDMRRVWRDQAQANHQAALRIAEAYRLARASEIRMRENR